jgi:hypothetical protein
MPASRGETGNSTSSEGLSRSDIIGIAVGVPSGVIALIGVIIAFLAWRYPDKFKKSRDKLLSLGRAYTNLGSQGITNSGNVETIVARDLHGGEHRDNRAPITYGNIRTINFSEARKEPRGQGTTQG